MARKSTGDYPENWDEIAKAVKDEANWKCVRCAHIHAPEDGYTLTVHHLDLNPANCAWWNIPHISLSTLAINYLRESVHVQEGKEKND